MAIPLQTTFTLPNAMLIPTVNISTQITPAGGLLSSANVGLSAATLGEDGKWVPDSVVPSGIVRFTDLSDMPADLKDVVITDAAVVGILGNTLTVQQAVGIVELLLVAVMGTANSVRKLV